ncbi:dimethyl sulfoxide reductase anchor subunit [Vibrio chagasii]|nr:dimethyl sulfoxide reductase anchor subunit [Vibrio chagasii]
MAPDLFTVLAQTAVGGYPLIGARALVLGYDEEKLNSYKSSNVHSVGINGAWFYVLDNALGSPLRAFNAFNQLGSAWLSNEVFFGAAFFAVGGLQWLLSVVKKGGMAIQKALMVGAMVLVSSSCTR